MGVDDHEVVGDRIVSSTGGFAVGPMGCFPTAEKFSVGTEGLYPSRFIDHEQNVVWADGQGSRFLKTAIGKPALADD